MNILSILMMLALSSFNENPETTQKSIEGVWELETYTRKGKTLEPKKKVHFIFMKDYMSEVVFIDHSNTKLNTRFYNRKEGYILTYFDQDFNFKAETYKIWKLNDDQLKLETYGNDFLVDNWSATQFMFHRVKSQS
jgi:hypothetical protein